MSAAAPARLAGDLAGDLAGRVAGLDRAELTRQLDVDYIRVFQQH